MGAVVVVRRLAIRFDTIITPRAVTPDVVEAGAVVIGHMEGTIWVSEWDIGLAALRKKQCDREGQEFQGDEHLF